MSSLALPGPPGLLRSPAAATLSGRFGSSVWAGTRFAAPAQPTRPTGYPALDAQLPGGGWPASGLTELLFDAPGSGEWRLLAPALRAQAPLRPVICVTPPLRPHAPALQGLSLPLARFVWVDPPAAADAAWALEQALRSGGCGTALWWGDAATPMLRRLHLAALEHGCLLLALRPPAARRQSSPAPLRLACRAAADQALVIEVFKRRGPAQAAPLRLHLPPLFAAPTAPATPFGAPRVAPPRAPSTAPAASARASGAPSIVAPADHAVARAAPAVAAA